MVRKLTNLEITVRIVPTMLRWPMSEAVVWRRLREGVEALRNMLHVLDIACEEIEHDHRLDPRDVKRRRVQIGEQALRELQAFKPLQSAEQAVIKKVNELDNSDTDLTKALDELREGVAAARRAVIERCQMRTGLPLSTRTKRT
jgi:hypothetical protein